MTDQYEYKIAQADYQDMGLVTKVEKLRKKDLDMLNRLGREGWDCYAVVTSVAPNLYYMKRKI